MRNLEANIYTFKVRMDADKSKIKQAISYIYNVDVEHVNILRKKPVAKRSMKGHRGYTKAQKYAMVKLKEGHAIDSEKPLVEEKES